MRRFISWLFSAPPQPISTLRVIWWWERRRIPFNGIIGLYGLVCLVAFFWAIGTSGRLEPGEDAVEPITLIAAPFGINALYTLGWLVEVPVRRLIPAVPPEFGPTLLKLGLGFGLTMITIPAGFWVSFRCLQLAGIIR